MRKLTYFWLEIKFIPKLAHHVSTYTVFTLELLHQGRYGTVRCGAVRACLHCSAEFGIPSNKMGAPVKIRMRELK